MIDIHVAICLQSQCSFEKIPQMKAAFFIIGADGYVMQKDRTEV